MREVLYEVDWQLIRINTLVDRRTDGGWATGEGTANNLYDFANYLKHGEVNVRMYRVHNMLNAVVMGYYGQRKLGVPTYQEEMDARIDQVRQFKNHYLTGEYSRSIVVAAGRTWNWDEQREKLEQLWKEDRGSFNFLRRNLHLRSTKGDQRTRPELHKFLSLMDFTV